MKVLSNNVKEAQPGIYIGHAKGFAIGLNQDNYLILVGENQTVVLGALNQRDIDNLCEYLQRLKIHTP